MSIPNPEIQKNLRHNYIVNLLDGGFFGFSIGFASFSTVIPLFVSYFTNSALLIGLIPAIHNTGWQLPQLLTANRISRMTKFKPYVVFMTIQERFPFLGLAFVALLAKSLSVEVALLLIFLLLIWQGLGAGLTANAWQNMISKIIPGDLRATFFGLQASAANLLASGSAVAAGFILDRQPFPYNFATVFFLCTLGMVVSWFFLNKTREPDRILEPISMAQPSLWKNSTAILKKDPSFAWFLVTRILSQFGSMAFAFYVVFADKNLGMDTITLGAMTGVLMITQTIANPSLGWISDHWGHRKVLIIGAIATSLSAVLAWQAQDGFLLALAFILAGISNTAFWTIGMAFTLDFGTEEERPTYVGLANTLIAPFSIIAPLLGGWLADGSGYPVTFIFAAVAGLVTAVVLALFIREPKPAKYA